MSKEKIKVNHLNRKAIIYLRQSSLKQVRDNTESSRRQYALKDRAKQLGWQIIETIDEDLGYSASASNTREGFKKLVASIAMGEVGIIFSLEVSRLSRTDSDWCQLIEVCRISDTLIGDNDQIYNTNSMDDQLILGIKGTMSVLELSVLKERMLKGQEEKAKRGELFKLIAPGYVCYDGITLVKDPDKRVQESVSLVFKKLKELNSARQVMLWFQNNNIELPVNTFSSEGRKIGWKIPNYSFIKEFFKNPIYAGAYVYGRRKRTKIVDQENKIKTKDIVVPYSHARVFIKDHHEGYISWEQFKENERMLSANQVNSNEDTSSTKFPGKGSCLLTGLIRCGICGRVLHVHYYGKKKKAGRYLCKGNHANGGKYCIGFGSALIDKKISEEILKIVQPYTFEASLKAIDSYNKNKEERLQHLNLKCQQTQYETNRAFEQYNKVDPANRLVAEQLEKRWNLKLVELEELTKEISKVKSDTSSLSDNEKQDIMELGQKFHETWNKSSCSIELKKKLIKLFIKEIIVSLDKERKELSFLIHWQGGSHTKFSMNPPQHASEKHRTSKENIEVIQALAKHYKDDIIAGVLSRLGRRTGTGKKWTKTNVSVTRSRYKIASPNKNTLDTNIVNLEKATKITGVSDTTIMKLIRSGILESNQIVPYAPLEIKKTDLEQEPVKTIIDHLKKTGKLILDRDSLSHQRTLFE